MDDVKVRPQPRRNRRGRYVKGMSGNPAGRPRGILNRATRIAAQLLGGEAEALMRKEIDLALGGDSKLLRHCVDRIIAPQREQPVLVAMRSAHDAADAGAAIGAVADAVLRGLITPDQAATLAQVFESQTRAAEAKQRMQVRHAAAEAPAIWNRMQLRLCLVIADGVREIGEEGGEVDNRVRELCAPILALRKMVLTQLAAVPDTVALVLADRAFIADHPVSPDHPPHPLAAHIGELYQRLDAYLEDRMGWLEARIEERAAARETAGEPDPIYRSWLFQPETGLVNFDARPPDNSPVSSGGPN